MGELSDKDLVILGAIQENCRMPFKDIAKKAGVPLSTVYAKIEKFEKDGIIEGYHAKLNKKKLGIERMSFTMISYDRSAAAAGVTPKHLFEELAKIPGIQEVYTIAGEWDVIIKMCSPHINHIGNEVTHGLTAVKGIDKSMTYVCFDEIKDVQAIRLNTTKE